MSGRARTHQGGSGESRNRRRSTGGHRGVRITFALGVDTFLLGKCDTLATNASPAPLGIDELLLEKYDDVYFVMGSAPCVVTTVRGASGKLLRDGHLIFLFFPSVSLPKSTSSLSIVFIKTALNEGTCLMKGTSWFMRYVIPC